jgi:hypothetical protein
MSELRSQGYVPANRFGLYAPMTGFNFQHAESLESDRWNQFVMQLHFVQHRNRTKTFSNTSDLLFAFVIA